MRAHRALRRDDRHIEVRPYLFRLVRNCCLDEIARSRTDSVALHLLHPGDEPASTDSVHSPARAARSADHHARGRRRPAREPAPRPAAPRDRRPDARAGRRRARRLAGASRSLVLRARETLHPRGGRPRRRLRGRARRPAARARRPPPRVGRRAAPRRLVLARAAAFRTALKHDRREPARPRPAGVPARRRAVRWQGDRAPDGRVQARRRQGGGRRHHGGARGRRRVRAEHAGLRPRRRARRSPPPASPSPAAG